MKGIAIILLLVNWQMGITQVSWVQKSDFDGTARWSAVGASIGNKGYIGMGRDSSGRQNDFWEWDQQTNSWSQKANFPGQGREGAIGFTIGNKVYIGTGYDGNIYQNDLWEWNQGANTWTQKASIPVGRAESIAFSIGNKGYICTGSIQSNPGGSNDLWEWDQGANTWSKKASIPAPITFLASGFSIGQKAYVLVNYDNFWEWDQLSNTWTKKANIGTSTNLSRAVDFAVNGKGYIGGVGQGKNEFWEYDPPTNNWTRLEDIPNGERGIAAGFSIDTFAYIGTGFDSPYKKDFWESIPYRLCAYPTVNVQPNNSVENLFSNASFTCSAIGANIAYQWQTDLGLGYQNISDSGQYIGTTTSVLTISNLATSNNNQQFRCIVSSGNCSIPTEAGSLTVLCIPLIDIHPMNQATYEDSTVLFFTQSQYSNVEYQWQTDFGSGFQNITNAGNYSGANTDSLTVALVTLANNNQFFRCIISSGNCSDTTEIAVLEVDQNTGLENFLIEEKVNLYPNPAYEIINVEVDASLDGLGYEIFSVAGKRVKQGKLTTGGKSKVDVTNLPGGLYMFRIGNGLKELFLVAK